MDIIFKEKDIIDFFSNTKNYVDEGTNGLVRKYDDSRLIKIYKEFVGRARINDYPEVLLNAKKLEEEKARKEYDYEIKKDHLRKIKSRLECTKYSYDLIQGNAIYNDFTFGAVLKNYEGFKKISLENTNLSNQELLELVLNIGNSLEDLYQNYIYPCDIKKSNVLFNDKMDVKLIDLDDFTTVYRDSESSIFLNCASKCYDNMIYRVRKNRR